MSRRIDLPDRHLAQLKRLLVTMCPKPKSGPLVAVYMVQRNLGSVSSQHEPILHPFTPIMAGLVHRLRYGCSQAGKESNISAALTHRCYRQVNPQGISTKKIVSNWVPNALRWALNSAHNFCSNLIPLLVVGVDVATPLYAHCAVGKSLQAITWANARKPIKNLLLFLIVNIDVWTSLNSSQNFHSGSFTFCICETNDVNYWRGPDSFAIN